MSSTEAVMESDQQQSFVQQALSLVASYLEARSDENLHPTRLELKNLQTLINHLLNNIDIDSIKVSLYKLLNTTENQIYEVEKRIVSGVYFSSLDQVWTSQELSFTTGDVSLFNRCRPVLTMLSNNGMTYYETTMEVIEKEMLVADDKSSSQSGSSSSQRGHRDIFGVVKTADIAHLMPNSPGDAAEWWMIVPGVLSCNARDPSDIKMNMFINGFCCKPAKDDASTRRVVNSGIKNFPTNKIRLTQQGIFLDRYHCVLIIPILPPALIKNWDGAGYDAIVLVAGRPNMVNSPAMVYQDIGAGKDLRDDNHILAKPEEIAICRNSLEELILVVVKSFYDHYATIEPTSSKDRTDTLAKLKDGFVCTPIDSSDSSPRRVRKIRFSDFHQNNNNNNEDLHRAPDPMLLLSKAVSNWLHIHNLEEILPSIENDTTSETTSMSSYDCREENHQVVYKLTCEPNHLPVGQRPEYVNNPPVTEISFINDGEFSVSTSND